jgi:hypothetical protein
LLDSIDRFANEALRADYSPTPLDIPGTRHGFDNKAWTQRGEEAILETLAFLKRHLEPRK